MGCIGDMGIIPDIGSIGFIVDCLVKLPALPGGAASIARSHCGNDRTNPAISGYEFRRDDVLSMLPVPVRIKRKKAWRRSMSLWISILLIGLL
jgi:hypothetical protein